jgi:hypothetical protein
VDGQGDPMAWSTQEGNAGAIFTDPNGVDADVVYDAPLGRFLFTSAHNPGGTNASASAGQVGLFEGPHPWGPWATVGYYDTWGNLGPDSFGDYLGLRFPPKWISPDGKTLWAVFSSLGQYDAFNLVKATLTVANTVPELIAPAVGTVLTPGEVVTAQGIGPDLSWSVDRLDRNEPAIASGAGASITFTVPSDAVANELIRITVTGRGGSVYRDFSVRGSGSGDGSAPEVTIDSVSTGKNYTLATAQIGAPPYIDRPYTLTALSSALTETRMIQTANDDKGVTTAAYLRFTLDRPGTVYVCYSGLATRPPMWLSDRSWLPTSKACAANDGVRNTRLVYQKSVPAGRVALGGNREAPASGPPRYSNFIVLVGR